MELHEAIGTLLVFGLCVNIALKMADDIFGVREVEQRHPGQRGERQRQVKTKPVMIRMWCDACKHIIARSPSGADHGHQTKWCDGAGGNLMWKLPVVEEVPIGQAIDRAEQLAQARDEEIKDWLMKMAGTKELAPEDIQMFREQLDLIGAERQQLELLAKEIEEKR